jgi:hypothetical protein
MGLGWKVIYIDNAVQIETYVNQAGETSHVCECSPKVLARINVLFLLIFCIF